jgi:tetratricopeptide (TPR) repeat protein
MAFADPVNKPKWFLDTARKFVRSQRPLRGEIEVEGAPEQTDAIDAIEKTIVEALASSRPRQVGRNERLRVLAEDAVLDELKANLSGIVLPEDFQRRFRGEAPSATGWFSAFTIYLAEQVKENDRFRKILVSDLLADLTQLGLETHDIVRAIDATIDDMSASLVRIENTLVGQTTIAERTETKVDAIQALLEQFIMQRGAAVADETNMPLATLKAILIAFGGQQADPEVDSLRIEQFLRKRAEEYHALKAQLERLVNDDPAVRYSRQQAQQAIDEGQFDVARGILLEILRRQRAGRLEMHELLQHRQRREAETCAALADLAKLGLRYLEATAHFDEAATLVNGNRELHWFYTLAAADALRTFGDEFGDNAGLVEAIRRYRDALALVPRSEVPFDWATTQNNLGNALSTLGQRESGTARLEEAIAAHRAALMEYSRERVPLDWATTQNNLGTALSTLGARESGTARLKEAVAAYRDALQGRARERVPLQWAETQSNLGNALARLGERESDTDRLEEAIAAYRAALQERTRERVPLDWATTQNNLGNALSTLGERESGTARLEEAVAAYRDALQEWTRERVPLQWATTQNNLGTPRGWRRPLPPIAPPCRKEPASACRSTGP